MSEDASWSGSRIKPSSDAWSDVSLSGLRDLGALARGEDPDRYDDLVHDVGLVIHDLLDDRVGDRSAGTFAWEAAPAGLLGFAGRSDWRVSEWVVCLFVEDDLRHSFVVDLTAARLLRLTAIADRLQDFVIEEVQGARPACPIHGHPLNAIVAGDSAEWQCPEDASTWSCEVGGYRAAARE